MTGNSDPGAVGARALTAGRASFCDRWQPTRRAVAPGRIELLGNHLDYNGGPVLAAAIDRFVAVLVERGAGPAGGIAAVAADVAPDTIETLTGDSLTDWRSSGSPQPLDYVRGVIAALRGRGNLDGSASSRLVFAGDVPIGFGLSSSAALCVALTLALADREPSPRETVLIAQEAEHRAGTPCGTMDQSASVHGGVIRYDGATLEVERLSPRLGDFVFVVTDSGVERALGASSYPRRVTEAKQALALLQARDGADLGHLAALGLDRWRDLEPALADVLPPPLGQRVRHVVLETDRVERGTAALRSGDWTRFGELMTASGHSSAGDYAISHPRVEKLVAEILSVDGVLGARMMGGGEGGAVLALVRRDRVTALDETLRRGYFARHGMAGRIGLFHACAFSGGATVVSLP